MRDQALYLRDILAAIESIRAFVWGLDSAAFQADDKTLSAVVRKFEIIGESVKHIPEDMRQMYPHVPWREVAGMRDRLIHFYFGVDAELVWQTVQEGLPVLEEAIRHMLQDQQ
jgi:uncharacterized protein with HEPN domain